MKACKVCKNVYRGQYCSFFCNKPKPFTNEEYLDLHGSKENAYLKARISSQEYFQLPKEKRRFYMRFCGHNEVYYILNPLIKI
jgi:hypothetical protein